MKLLIDADYYLYRAASAHEYEFEIQEDFWTYLCRIDHAKASFTEDIEYLSGKCPDHEVVICFGDKTNFRYTVYPQYKSNRRKYRRPAGYKALREWAEAAWGAVVMANVEGDDVLALTAEPGDVIAAVDKDLKTVPGLHLQGEEIEEVSLEQANKAFYMQILTGDTCDGYPGCPKYGPVAAGKALTGCETEEEMWDEVLNAYIKAGHNYRFALQMARCARILRPGEYDYERNQPVLWQPPC